MNFITKFYMIIAVLFSLAKPTTIICKDKIEEQPDKTHEQVHAVIEQKLQSFNGSKDSNDVVALFVAIKQDLETVLASAPEKHKALREAVRKLDPKNLFAMITCLKTILNNIDPKTKELILKNVPDKFKPFIA